MKHRIAVLNTIPFIACLLLLLLNDFYLKAAYHNWLTGKLSDFCGLFVFVFFWAALFPKQKRIVYFSTALLFILWKSPYAQGFIEFFSQNVYAIQRVVDVSDLLALFVLPMAYLYRPINPIRFRLNPLFIALLTIFSFCATSHPRATQSFEQPQYLLFKSGDPDIDSKKRWYSHGVHKQDSLIIIDISQIGLDEWPPLKDEYFKVQILKDLDLRFIKEMKGAIDDELVDFEGLRDSLTLNKQTSIKLDWETHREELSFNGSRLAGDYKRFSKSNQVLIDGQYKAGIEDSIWTYYNKQNEVIERKEFIEGELVKNEKFKNGKLLSTKSYDTREERIQYKYFHLAVIGLLMIVLLIWLYTNYKRSKPEDIIKWPTYANILTAFSLPILVLLIGRMISEVIPNPQINFFLDWLFELTMLYITVMPLSLIVLFGLKLRSKFDLILYILLFSLGLVLVEEWNYLQHLLF